MGLWGTVKQLGGEAVGERDSGKVDQGNNRAVMQLDSGLWKVGQREIGMMEKWYVNFQNSKIRIINIFLHMSPDSCFVVVQHNTESEF